MFHVNMQQQDNKCHFKKRKNPHNLQYLNLTKSPIMKISVI